MHSHWPARTPAAMAGALKFPAFLLFWSLGLLLAAGAVLPADALVRKSSMTFVAMSELPTLEDREAFGAALETELRESAVVNGAWQPRVERSVPVAVPQAPPMLSPRLTVRSPQAADTPEPEAAEAIPVTAEADNGSSGAGESEAEAEREAAPRLALEGIVRVSSEGAAPEPQRVAVQPRPASRTPVGGAPMLKPTAVRALEGAQRALTEGRFAAAYRLLMGEVEDAAAHPTYLGVLAVSALALGRDAEALLIYERLTQLAPDDGRWWAGAALSRERLGLEAAPQFEAVLELAGDDDTLQSLAASRLKELG